MADGDRIQLGIPGLDAMLDGGLISGSIALLQGAPGTGKTTVGMQFCTRGPRSMGSPGC
jgi:circadian clock protein KaiC